MINFVSLKILSVICNSGLRQKDADSSTLQGKLLEVLFQTSCAVETDADYVEVIQSNSCFLFSTRIDLSSTNEMPSNTEVDSYSLPSSIWENFDIIREMYFPSNFIGTEHVTSNLELHNITKELDKINSELIGYKKNVSNGSNSLKWKLQPKTRDGIENQLGEPGMRRRIGRVLNETVPTSRDEADMIMSNNAGHGLISARYEKVWEEESRDKVIRERRMARERTLLNKSNFEASMNGSLIKTPSVCMSHTDIEATNNESSELDKSDDELTKELFQPKPRISIGQKRRKKKLASNSQNATQPISQPQPITSSTQMMVKSQGESSNRQSLSDINESLEDLNDISVMAGGPNLVSVPNLANASNLVEAPNSENAPNVGHKDTRMDETIADTGNETLTQEMDVTLEKSTMMNSSKKKSKKNKKEKTKKKKFRKSLGF